MIGLLRPARAMERPSARPHALLALPWTATTLVAAALLLVVLLLLSRQDRFDIYNDDALFYGIIAANTANGQLFSFDGISATTGFHWLGMVVPLVVALLYRAIHGDVVFRDFLDWLYVVDSFLLVGLSLALVAVLRHHVRHHALLPVALLVLLSQTLLPGFGMEAVYLPLLLVLHAWLVTQAHPFWPARFALPLLITVCRVDYAPVAAAMGLAALLHRRQWSTPSLTCAVALSMAGVAAGVVTVAGLNYLVGGQFASSSALAKSLGSSYAAGDLLANLPRPRLAMAMYSAALVYLLWRRPMRTPFNLVLWAAGAVLMLQVYVMRAIGGPNLGGWYDVAWRSLLVMVGLFIAGDLLASERSRRLAGATRRLPLRRIVAVAIVGVLGFWALRESLYITRLVFRTDERRAWHRQLEQVGSLIRAHTSDDARLATSDGPGSFHYFSGRQVIALDGLVNSPDYVLNYLGRQRVDVYVREHADYVLVLLAQRRPAPIVTRDALGQEVVEYEVPLGFPSRPQLPPSQFRFRDSQVVFKKQGTLWSGFDEVWLVKVR